MKRAEVATLVLIIGMVPYAILAARLLERTSLSTKGKFAAGCASSIPVLLVYGWYLHLPLVWIVVVFLGVAGYGILLWHLRLMYQNRIGSKRTKPPMD